MGANNLNTNIQMSCNGWDAMCSWMRKVLYITVRGSWLIKLIIRHSLGIYWERLSIFRRVYDVCGYVNWMHHWWGKWTEMCNLSCLQELQSDPISKIDSRYLAKDNYEEFKRRYQEIHVNHKHCPMMFNVIRLFILMTYKNENCIKRLQQLFIMIGSVLNIIFSRSHISIVCNQHVHELHSKPVFSYWISLAGFSNVVNTWTLCTGVYLLQPAPIFPNVLRDQQPAACRSQLCFYCILVHMVDYWSNTIRSSIMIHEDSVHICIPTIGIINDSIQTDIFDICIPRK